MTASTPCPSPEKLASLLTGTLHGDEPSELTTHLDHCTRCRQELERLAGGDETWREALRSFGAVCADSESEPALQDVLAKLRGPVFGTTASEPSQSADDVMSFLTPSGKPEQLGRLAHYEILQVIGRGGMGVVFKAFDAQLHRVVAIKVMSPALATSGSARQRFGREAKAAAAVRNEHVIDIHAVGEENGLPYLVMEYIAGRSLEERIEQTGPMGLKEILRIGLQTANGLAAAHAQGLIHRDIKPANILLENGVERVKITDFGLARAVDDASLTQSGVITGTPQYMSPEQARGETIDHRSDLFSVGSVLYAMCAGRPPFRASTTMGVIRLVSDGSPRPIRQINPDISERLAEIIAKLHAKDAAARFQSAAEVAAALEQHLAEVQRPDWNRQAPRIEERIRKPRRRRWVVAATAAALLLIGLGMSEATGVTQVVPTVIRIARGDGTLVVEVEDPAIQVTIEGDSGEIALRGGGIQEIRLRPGSYRVKPSGEGKPVSSVEAVTITRGGKCLVRVTNEAAKTLAPPRNPKQPHPAVTVTITPAPSHELPVIPAGAPLNTAALVSKPEPLEGVRSWTIETARHRSAVEDVAYSPDGHWLATACRDGSVRIWNGETRRLKRVLVAPSYTGKTLQGLAWSPDSRYLATCNQDFTVQLWELATGRMLRQLASLEPIYTIKWSPDGRLLAGSGWSPRVPIWEVATGRRVWLLKGHTRGVQGLAWSPDGKQLATGSEDKTVRLWDSATGRLLHTLEGHRRTVKAVAFSSDGSLLASASFDGTVRLWQPDREKCLHTLHGHENEVYCLAWSPDGKLLASGGVDHTVQLWNPADGKHLRALEGHHHIVGSLSWSPNGQTLASGSWDTTVMLWSFGGGAPSTLPGVSAWSFNFPLWSPNGKYLVTAARNARLWNAETGQQIHAFAEQCGIVRAWSPDSKWLVSADWKGGLWIWDREEHSHRSFTLPSEKVIRAAAASPDGKVLATGDEGGNVALWGANEKSVWQKGKAPDRAYLTDPGQPKAGIDALAFSPDSRMLAAADTEGRVHLWDVKRRRKTYTPHTKRIRTLAWAPQGRIIATGGEDMTVRLWDSDTGKILNTLTDFHDVVWSLAFSPEGKILAASDGWGDVLLFDAATGQTLRHLRGSTAPLLSLTWSPDGKQLAGGGELSTTHIWDAATGKVQKVLMGLPLDEALAVEASGNYRCTPAVVSELVYIVQTDKGQETLTSEGFAKKYKQGK